MLLAGPAFSWNFYGTSSKPTCLSLSFPAFHSVQFLLCGKHKQQECNILPVSLTLKFLLTYTHIYFSVCLSNINNVDLKIDSSLDSNFLHIEATTSCCHFVNWAYFSQLRSLHCRLPPPHPPTPPPTPLKRTTNVTFALLTAKSTFKEITRTFEGSVYIFCAYKLLCHVRLKMPAALLNHSLLHGLYIRVLLTHL